MAMDRWDPMREMLTWRDAMDRLFQESLVRPTSALFSGMRGAAPIDLAESDTSYTLHASMPGIDPNDVQITVSGDTVTLRGESKAEQEQQNQSQNWIMRERRGMSFYRTITLPSAVNADQAQAQYENGVLTLTLPKLQSAQPRQIKVTGASRGQGSQQPVVGSTATGTPVTSAPPTDQAVTSGQQTGSQTNASQSAMPPTGAGAQQGISSGNPDIVTEASEDSFPASDPPSYYRDEI